MDTLIYFGKYIHSYIIVLTQLYKGISKNKKAQKMYKNIFTNKYRLDIIINISPYHLSQSVWEYNLVVSNNTKS